MNESLGIEILKLYLDTSVISALFDKRNPERKALTEQFFEMRDEFEIFISELVLAEIDDIKDEILKREFRKEALKYKILQINEEIRILAKNYVDNGAIPEKYSEDGLHIAIATLNKMDYLLSWNFRHIVKIKTRKIVNEINNTLGYPELNIITPAEII